MQFHKIAMQFHEFECNSITFHIFLCLSSHKNFEVLVNFYSFYFVSCPEVRVMKRRHMTRIAVCFILFLVFSNLKGKLNDEEGQTRKLLQCNRKGCQLSFLQTMGSKSVQKHRRIDKMTCNATIERITVLGSFSMTCVFELGKQLTWISYGLELRLGLKL